MVRNRINFIGGMDKSKLIIFLFAQISFAMLTKLPFYHSTITLFLEYIYFALLVIVFFYLRINGKGAMVMQLTIQLMITSLIWFGGITNKYTSKSNKMLIAVGVISILACWLQVLLLSKINRHIREKGIDRIKSILIAIYHNKKIHIIALIFVVLSVSVLNYVPYNDSACYYSWNIKFLSDMFEFSAVNMQWLMLANHFSTGYGLFTLIGELILPHFTVGVHLVNLILAVISIYCFYGILKRLCSSDAKKGVVLGTAIYAFTPYLLGLIGEINVDIASIYLFVIFLFCYVNHFFYLTMLFGWFFIFTKEPAVIYYCFFLFGILILSVYRKKLVDMLGNLITLASPVIYWGITFFAVNMEGGYWVKNLYTNETSFNTLGFTVENMILKIKEIFLLNFNWIYLILILLLVFNKRTFKKIAGHMDYYIPLFVCFLGFVLFNTFYITFQHPRYIAIGTIFLMGIVVPLFIDVYKGHIKTYGFMHMMIAALFIQSFITIDPVTISLFARVNKERTGSNIVNMSYQQCFDDSSIYNREYLYYREILDFALADLEFSPNMALVFPPAYSTGEQKNIMYWSTEKKRVVASETEDSFLIKFINKDEPITSDYDKLIYIYPMWLDPDYNIMTENGNRGIASKETYNYRGFKVRCFEVNL